MNPDFDARDFRDAVGWFATGVTVITTRASGGAVARSRARYRFTLE